MKADNVSTNLHLDVWSKNRASARELNVVDATSSHTPNPVTVIDTVAILAPPFHFGLALPR